MKILKDYKLIINLLEKSKINNEKLSGWDNETNENSKIIQLYNLIKHNEEISYEELELSLYRKSLKVNHALNKLIFRFEEKLFNKLFLIDSNTPLFSERSKAYLTASKRTFVTKFLIDRGITLLALNLAEKTLHITTKYEFTDLSLLLTQVLIRQYSTTYLSPKKYIKYNELFEELNIILNHELLVENLSNKIRFMTNFVKRDKIGFTFNKDFQDKFENLLTYLKNNNPTLEMIVNGSTLIQNVYRIKKDYQSFKFWSDYFMQKIVSKNFISPGAIETISILRLQMSQIYKDINTIKEIELNYLDKRDCKIFCVTVKVKFLKNFV